MGKPIKYDARCLAVDMEEALDMVEEYKRGTTPIIFGAAAKWKRISPFEILREVFNICPGAYQWDEVTGRVIEIANLYAESKPPPELYDRHIMGLVQIAAGSQAEYYRQKMPKPKDVDQRVKGK